MLLIKNTLARTLKNFSILTISILASQTVLAGPISYTINYAPGITGLTGDTTIGAQIFLDDSSITGIGKELITLTGLSATFSGSAFDGEQTYLYTNTNTSACTFNCGFFGGTGHHVPFAAEFINGSFTGLLTGVQSGPGALLVARLSFGVGPKGFFAHTMFFGGPVKYNTQRDSSAFVSKSGPSPVSPPAASVPEPDSLLLLALGLLAVGNLHRKRGSTARLGGFNLRLGNLGQA